METCQYKPTTKKSLYWKVVLYSGVYRKPNNNTQKPIQAHLILSLIQSMCKWGINFIHNAVQ